MNKLIINSAFILMALVMIFPGIATSQEKKVRVKTIKVIDGKEVVTDTTYSIKEGDSHGDIEKKFTWVGEADSIATITMDVDIDSDIETDADHNVIIMKSGHHGGKFNLKDGEKSYKIKVISDDGDENVFFYEDFDFDIDKEEIDKLKIIMKEHGDEMKKIKIELDDEKLIMLKELEGLEEIVEIEKLEHLKELEKLKEIKDIEIITSDFHDFHDHNEFYFHNSCDRVSDKELRDAGIKNKQDRLVADDFDMDIKDGVVDIEFKLATEGAPKVVVFNYFGEKVFTGKPELMNGQYMIKMDLSAKQHGTYYLQVIQKNSSLTKKIKL